MTAAVPLAMLVCLACAVDDITASAEDRFEVDLELILAVDVSRSMDDGEHRLQREGYIAAFRHPDLMQAIEAGPLGRVAVVYFEWAGPRHQSVAVPWTVLDNADDAATFADKLAAQPILPEAGTSISASLAFAERLFPVSGTRGLRRAIDISGDGVNNDGPPVAPVRARLIAAGITINGLPIELGTDARGEVAPYYEQNVIGGPGAFAITVDDPARFADAIRRKLVHEIASSAPTVIPARSFVRRDFSGASYWAVCDNQNGSKLSIADAAVDILEPLLEVVAENNPAHQHSFRVASSCRACS